MTSLFSSYESEYQSYLSNIKNLTKKMGNMKTCEKRKKIEKKIDKKLSQLKAVLDNMELEANDNKENFLILQDCKEEFLEVEKETIKMKNKAGKTDKEKLFFTGDAELEELSDQKTKLLNATQKAMNGEDSIEKSLKSLNQIDEKSGNTFDELVNQREKIQTTINKVHNIKAEGSLGSRIVSRMKTKKIINSIILLAIILILLVAIGLIVFFGFINPFIIPLFKKTEPVQQ